MKLPLPPISWEILIPPPPLLILVSFLQSIYFDLHIFQCIFVIISQVFFSAICSFPTSYITASRKATIISRVSMYFPQHREQFSTQISSLHFLTDSLYHSVWRFWEYFFYAFQAPCERKPIWPNFEMKKWILAWIFCKLIMGQGKKKILPIVLTVILENKPHHPETLEY